MGRTEKAGEFAVFHIALWEPEIPPNAGNVARLCAATNTTLHFIGRIGFRLDDKTLKRAGLDYWPFLKWERHETWQDFESIVLARDRPSPPAPLPLSTNPGGRAAHGFVRERGANVWLVDNPAPARYTDVRYRPGDCLVFGSESKGLPASLREQFSSRLVGIPMANANVRSLNLATAAGIVLYEALRQQHDC
jgi:tRNA (cytidine/uridine-2'-O-)-methyltransferase